ncbi:MAG: BlaI/MecI/CopY family transcriptional regulator [Gammaproteobacteria bacterium]|jgi:predicted transcriptional regulator
MAKDIHLSDSQLAIMRALWQRGEASTAAVHEIVGGERGLAYTTVATMLKRLEKRGVIRARREGRELVFSPAVSEGEVRESMVSGLVASLFRGDSAALMTHLVRSGEVASEDLDEVKRLLREGGDK